MADSINSGVCGDVKFMRTVMTRARVFSARAVHASGRYCFAVKAEFASF